MVLPPRNGLSLCAGAGGLDMGLMLAEQDFHTRCFVEWDEYPRQTLIAAQRAGYFEPAPIWDDVTTFDAKPLAGAIDTIIAGYPCQPFSSAGQRNGENDERHLWPDIERIIGELGPTLRWCFFENVAGHLSLGLDTVLRSLRDLGFTSAAGLFSAEEVGAPHERQRVFIVAYRAGEGRSERRQTRQSETESQGGTGMVAEPERRVGKLADTDGRNPGAEREQRSGEVRTEPEFRSGRDTSAVAGRELADAQRHAGHQGRRGHWSDRAAGGNGATDWIGSSRPSVFPPGPSDAAAWSSVIAMAPHLAPAVAFDNIAHRARNLAQMVALGELEEAEAEPELRRMADGLAQRARALRLLGNGVVPLAAAYAWRTLSAAHGLGWVDMDGTGRTGAATKESNA